MARKKILKDKDGNTIYPVTIPQAVVDPETRETLKERLDTEEGRITATEEALDGCQKALIPGNGIALDDSGHISAAIEPANDSITIDNVGGVKRIAAVTGAASDITDATGVAFDPDGSGIYANVETVDGALRVLAQGYKFMGVATPATNPGTPDQKVFYLAGPGNYVNFNNESVNLGEIGIFRYDNVWNVEKQKILPLNIITESIGCGISTALSLENVPIAGHPARYTGVYEPSGYFQGYFFDLSGYYERGYRYVYFRGANAAVSSSIVRGMVVSSDRDVYPATVESSTTTESEYTEGWQRLPITADSKYLWGSYLNESGITVHPEVQFMPEYVMLLKETPEEQIEPLVEALTNINSTLEDISNVVLGGIKNTALSLENAPRVGHPARYTGVYEPSGYFQGYFFDLSGYYERGYRYVYFRGANAAVSSNIVRGMVVSSDRDVYPATVESSTTTESEYTEGWQRLPITADSKYLWGSYLNESGITVHPEVQFMPEYVMLFKEDSIGVLEELRIVKLQNASERGMDASRYLADTLTNGNSLLATTFPYANKCGNRYMAEAKITSFDKIIIANGYNTYRCVYFEITGTSVNICFDSTGSFVETYEHGLSITSFIKVNIQHLESGQFSINIFTLGGNHVHVSDFSTYDGNGLIAIISEGSTLSDIRLSVANRRLSSPIWIFGASYEGVTSDRWVGQCKQFGYFNFLVNAYAGRTSPTAYADLIRALNFGCPKYLYWTMWGNDTVADLDYYLDKVKKLCEDKGITLIIIDRPNSPAEDIVTTYLARKAVIDKYIAMGVRYVDAANTLSAEPSNAYSWYEGFLYSDEKHPTELGAKALCLQVLTDFPEIMQYDYN